MLRRWGELAPKGRIVLTASGRLAMNGPTTNEALMSLPRTVTAVLKNHVTLEVESIDRMYLNVYVPGLQTDAGVAYFWRSLKNQFQLKIYHALKAAGCLKQSYRRRWPSVCKLYSAAR